VLARCHHASQLFSPSRSSRSVIRLQFGTEVRHFRRAYSKRRWFEAVELYRGALLQGIEVPFSPGFEAWLHTERDGLEHA
jgi:hypothetical protein